MASHGAAPPGDDGPAALMMTPAQISEAQKLAREWTEKHGK
jgi:hypothetical protein